MKLLQVFVLKFCVVQICSLSVINNSETDIHLPSPHYDELKQELLSVRSEVRAVASLASQCADAKEAIRQCENDHTILHWIKVIF